MYQIAHAREKYNYRLIFVNIKILLPSKILKNSPNILKLYNLKDHVDIAITNVHKELL
jgi:hypothetical protein